LFSRDLERLVPATAQKEAAWERIPDFLDVPRTMHYTLLLPTKQLLVIGGGHYSYSYPALHPLLLTADPKAAGGYRTERMNPGTYPRLYHNTPLLLPDGRVFLAGGNSARAQWNEGTSRVNLKVYQPGVVEKGEALLDAEIWQPEIFSPPYLFLPGERPEIVRAPATLAYGAKAAIRVKHRTDKGSLVLIKLGSSTHAWDCGQRLVDVSFETGSGPDELTLTAPGNRHLSPPGYYMLFYVNALGKPSRAAMVQLGVNEKGVIIGRAEEAPGRSPRRALGPGDLAPAWKALPGADGRRWSLDDFADRAVLVVAFLRNDCALARASEERLSAFARAHAGPGGKVGVVALNVNVEGKGNDLEALKKREQGKPFGFPYLHDASQETGLAYGVQVNPEFFVLGRDRRVVYRGRLDDNDDPREVQERYLEAAVEAALAGKAPAVAETDPAGCTVIYRVGK
jgi:hypothetical protein